MNRVPIGQIAQLNPRTPKNLNEDQKISFLPMASVSEDGKVVEQEDRTFSKVKKGYKYFERGDIIVAKITPCFENGKAALTDSLENQIGFGSTEFHVIRPDKSKIDTKYLFSIIWSNRFRYLGEKSMKGAAGQKRIPIDFIKDYEIPLPSLEDQRRIAHMLEKLEGLISRRKEHLQQLEALLKSIFLDMFGDPITNPYKFPIEKLSNFYINPKEGTKCGPFGSALKKSELVESGISVWNMDNIGPTGHMALPFRMWITEEKYQKLAPYSVIDGDIIISRAGTVGKMCVAKMNGEPGIISTNLIRLRLNDKLRPQYFTSLMTHCKGRIGRLKTGPDGALTHMNTGILNKLEFPYPPVELQEQFICMLEKVETLKHRYRKSITDLEMLYATLTQKAFKGELDLSRVALPAEDEQLLVTGESKDTIIDEASSDSQSLENVDNYNFTFPQFENRKQAFKLWLTRFIEQVKAEDSLSVQSFMFETSGMMAELSSEGLLEEMGLDKYDDEISISDYEIVKSLIFNMIKDGTLAQKFDDDKNAVLVVPN